MNTEEVYEMVDAIQTQLEAILERKTVKIEKDKIEIIGTIYKQIMPNRRLNLACAQCVEIALVSILDWINKNPKPIIETTNKKKK